MWEFIIPLILSIISPETLLPTALFGFLTTGSRVIFGTGIGNLVDKSNRLWIVFLGTTIQAFSISVSGLCIYFLLVQSESNTESNLKTDIFATWQSSFLMSILLVSATIGSLAAMSMDLAVERDWVPTVVTKEAQLTIVNTRMRQVDLATEVGGPFVAGFLLLAGTKISFLLVASFNFLTFFPQYQLLRSVYVVFPRLAEKIQENQSLTPPAMQDNDNDSTSLNIQDSPQSLRLVDSTRVIKNHLVNFFAGEWNPLANIYRGWSIFMQQPIRLVVISYALLWVSLLSPHDPVFTSYLQEAGYDQWMLGLFRGIGALFGVVSGFAFPWFVQRYGLKLSSFFFIAEEGFFLLLSGIMFQISVLVSDPTLSQLMRYSFLLFIILSRCGLYGFEIGEIQIIQQTIPEAVRGRVSSVEASLTSLASLVFFVAGMIWPNKEQFLYLLWASIFFITLGVVVFTLWCLMWDIHTEEHYHGKEDIDEHEQPFHTHTVEQDREKEERGGLHSHLHLHQRRPFFVR